MKPINHVDAWKDAVDLDLPSHAEGTIFICAYIYIKSENLHLNSYQHAPTSHVEGMMLTSIKS